MELIKELGRRIQKARKEKGLTQQELADLSHVSLKHVQGCESVNPADREAVLTVPGSWQQNLYQIGGAVVAENGKLVIPPKSANLLR